MEMQREDSHMGVTPTKGADTPAYSPYSIAIRSGVQLK